MNKYEVAKQLVFSSMQVEVLVLTFSTVDINTLRKPTVAYHKIVKSTNPVRPA